ncbi:endonuclease/exonuclease/phosphatase family protein [Nocardia amamiensis]|uniref:endonuclease/exonuclease/phosphatase family protein n=1 Tax=Nocardia amamiensis TaxID=404578 RepID=UPI0033EB4045
MPSNDVPPFVLSSNVIAALEAAQDAAEWWQRMRDLVSEAAKLAWLGEPVGKAESTNHIGGKYRHFTNGIWYRYAHNDGKQVWGTVPRGGVYELWTRSGWEYGPFGYPVGLPEVTGDKTKCMFEGGTITSVAEKRRSVMFYNTALIGVDGASDQSKFPYTGRGRAAQRKAVAQAVSEARADVVVLAEMMINQDRAKLKDAVKDIYPYSADGPDEDDHEEDSGLLVLSRHPIREVRTTIFRSCCGVDCLANKGAVMVRVAPSGGPEFCVVGTHLQAGSATSCPDPLGPGVGSGAKGKREAQLRHLDSWILGIRDLDLPVIIVGDFNINADTQTGRELLQTNMSDARDLWPEYQMWLPADKKPEKGEGITSDKKSTYQTGSLKMDSPDRSREGSRIDLVLLDQGERVTAHINKMSVLKPELSPGSGIDVSDHYAIKATFDMATVTHKLNRRVRKTSAWLKYIHALELTDGGFAGVEAPWYSKQDPDNVDVSARIYKGVPATEGRPRAKVEYDLRTMSMGERHEYSYKRDKTLIFDGSDDVHMEITLEEVDKANVLLGEIEVDRTAIGRDRDVIVPKSSQLLHALNGRRYAPNVMYGDGSEYVAILQVNVEIEPFTHR